MSFCSRDTTNIARCKKQQTFLTSIAGGFNEIVTLSSDQYSILNILYSFRVASDSTFLLSKQFHIKWDELKAV